MIPTAPFGELPYGPRMTRALGPLHAAFQWLNRWLAVPALRAGLGPLFSTPLAGSIMVLRTTGRRSGLPREAPLGYVIDGGAVYCCAGFGARTAWYRNLTANPHVEIVLPTMAFSGVAEVVSDRSEWDRVFPTYVRALGLVGRLTLGNLGTADPEQIESIWRTLPLVRIRPIGLATGPADPGGRLWVVVQTTMLVLVVRLLVSIGRRFRNAARTSARSTP